MAKKNKKRNKKLKNLDFLQQALAQYGLNLKANNNPSWLGSVLGSRSTSEQFLIGALVGAAAAYLLTDEALRSKLLKAGYKLYAGAVSGAAEMKEQLADIRAEFDAEQFTAD